MLFNLRFTLTYEGADSGQWRLATDGGHYQTCKTLEDVPRAARMLLKTSAAVMTRYAEEPPLAEEKVGG